MTASCIWTRRSSPMSRNSPIRSTRRANSAPITVRYLLTMSAGLPQDDPWADRHLDFTPVQFSEVMAHGLALDPAQHSLRVFQSGLRHFGAGDHQRRRDAYQQYIRQNILVPLGMTSSTYDVHQVDPARLAMGYRRLGDQWVADPPLEDGEFGSMGGLFTTINDFSRYMAFLLSAYPPRDDDETGPIRRSSAREMQQPWRQRLVASARATPDAPAFTRARATATGWRAASIRCWGTRSLTAADCPATARLSPAAGSRYRLGGVRQPDHLALIRHDPGVPAAVQDRRCAHAHAAAAVGCAARGSGRRSPAFMSSGTTT
ncbi:MAG: serine hydrolase domain-containing protein [Anaerolineae bacterium]